MVEMLRRKGMIIVLVVEYKLFFAASIFLVNIFRANATIFKIWFMGSISSDKSVVMLEILRTIMIVLGVNNKILCLISICIFFNP